MHFISAMPGMSYIFTLVLFLLVELRNMTRKKFRLPAGQSMVLNSARLLVGILVQSTTAFPFVTAAISVSCRVLKNIY